MNKLNILKKLLLIATIGICIQSCSQFRHSDIVKTSIKSDRQSEADRLNMRLFVTEEEISLTSGLPLLNLRASRFETRWEDELIFVENRPEGKNPKVSRIANISISY